MATVPISFASLPDGADTDVLREAGEAHVWMHGSSWRALARESDKRILVEGQGCIVKDIDGKEYIDALAGLWLVNVGHGRKEIAAAMAAQAGTLAYGSSMQTTTIPAIQLATLLADITPGDLSTVFFCSGGSEAVESAVKIARQYQHLAGYPKRLKIIGRRGSYHGATYGAMSVSGTRQLSEPYYSPFMNGTLHVAPPYCYRCDYRHTYPSCDVYCVDAIEQLITYESAQTVAAVIAEPVSASCGIVVPPPEYLPRLREICDRHGVLLIVDEVINGFGRTGKMFASEHWDLVGDIMTMAKGLSSGYAPIAATICRPRVAEIFTTEAGKKLSHLLTFGGQAVACAAALENIAIIQREGLVENAATQGAYLLEQLQGLQAHHPTIGDVRGLGLLAAIELVQNRDSKEKFPADGEVAAFHVGAGKQVDHWREQAGHPLPAPVLATRFVHGIEVLLPHRAEQPLPEEDKAPGDESAWRRIEFVQGHLDSDLRRTRVEQRMNGRPDLEVRPGLRHERIPLSVLLHLQEHFPDGLGRQVDPDRVGREFVPEHLRSSQGLGMARDRARASTVIRTGPGKAPKSVPARFGSRSPTGSNRNRRARSARAQTISAVAKRAPRQWRGSLLKPRKG